MINCKTQPQFIDSLIDSSDYVYRNKTIECHKITQYKSKLIRLIELTPVNTRARVKIKYEYTEEFKMESGVKQRVSLPTTLFIVVVDVKLKQLYLR